MICDVVTAAKVYRIRAMIKNVKLIEFNDRLSPELLVNKTETEGFLAILMFRNLEPTDGPKELVRHIFKSEKNLI